MSQVDSSQSQTDVGEFVLIKLAYNCLCTMDVLFPPLSLGVCALDILSGRRDYAVDVEGTLPSSGR